MNGRYFATLAAYNAWANRRLFEACERLSATEYMQERVCFFGSIHATLNHILVADRVWMARIGGQIPPYLKFDRILYGDLTGLKVARIAEDDHIRIMVDGFTEQRLNQRVEYRNSRGDRLEAPLQLVLGNFFNHQTHHRAQVHGLLSQTDVPPPPLDLIIFIRERRAGAKADSGPG
jgi:uncharacterized damage-inducible protein DinB